MHGKGNTAKNDMAKDICRVPFCLKHGVAFVVFTIDHHKFARSLIAGNP
jgi:hypothetical protein